MRNKFTPNFFFTLAFLIILFSIPAKAQDKSKDDEISKLRDKIEVLEKKLQSQENQINILKNEVEELIKRQPMLAVPDFKNKNDTRKWKSFKFNGQLYYMVPLNTETLKKEINK